MKWMPVASSGTPARASTTAASWAWGRRSASARASCTPTVQWASGSSPARATSCGETARSAHEQGRKQEDGQEPDADRFVPAACNTEPQRGARGRPHRRGFTAHRHHGCPCRPGEEGRGRGGARPAGGVRVHRLPGDRKRGKRPAAGGHRRQRGEGADRAGAPRDRQRGTAWGPLGPARFRRRGRARVPRGGSGALRSRRPVGRRSAHRGGVKIRLLSVGKDKGPTAELAQEYADRIRRFADLDVIELRAADPAAEADALLGKTRGELWGLDERGGALTSTQLAQRIGKLRDSAQALTLCIGGDEGLGQPVRDAARFIWSLSPLTLPHRLARVVALEQLYRSFEILRGGPYHK